MKIRIALQKTDLRAGIAWDPQRRVLILALLILSIRFELGGALIELPSTSRAVSLPDAHPDDALLLAAIRREPDLHWQAVRSRIALTTTRVVHARERLLAAGTIVPARNAAGQRVLRAVDP